MGWFSRKPAAVELEISGDVVGESHYRPNIAEVVAAVTGGPANTAGGECHTRALIVAEANDHDPNAIAVKHGGLCLGYLPRGSAAPAQWQALRESGGVEVGIRIGWGSRMLFGVTISGI